MDITKCTNQDCKVKDNCLRYLAKDNEYWQSYADFVCNKENNWKYKLRVNILE
jgi:hypothetical protein